MILDQFITPLRSAISLKHALSIIVFHPAATTTADAYTPNFYFIPTKLLFALITLAFRNLIMGRLIQRLHSRCFRKQFLLDFHATSIRLEGPYLV